MQITCHRSVRTQSKRITASSIVKRLLISIGFSVLLGLLGWMAQITSPFASAARLAEPETSPLVRQIGMVAMPFKGYLSAAIYDAEGRMIRTLFSHASQPKGEVALSWDGRDDLGRLVYQNGTYIWKALVNQVKAVEQGGIGDSQFDVNVRFPEGTILEANDQVDCIAVNSVGGMIGEAGGTLARNDRESSYGDTKFSQTLSLSDAISASGSISFTNQDVTTMDGEFFVGHYSSSTEDNRREFIGMEFTEGHPDGQLQVRARMYRPDGNNGNGAASEWVTCPGSGEYQFEYTYDPTFESDSGHSGPEGKVTLRIVNGPAFDVKKEAVFESGHRDSGARFDAFGMGIAAGAVPSADSKKTVKAYIDNITYTGHTGTVDFSSDPGWTGSGNAASGNSYTWNQYDSADGSIYQASQGEEGSTLRRLSKDGKPIWQQGGVNIGVAANAKHVFVSQKIKDLDRIIRVSARDGSYAPFNKTETGNIIVSDETFDPRPKGQNRYTPEQYRQFFSLWGMAADNHRVWVSNFRKDRVEVYDAQTGAKLAQLPMNSPLGIAIESDKPDSGIIWVSNNSDRVSRIEFKVKDGGYKFAEDNSRRIADLREPSGLSIGGPNRHLFVAEKATGKIREYDLNAAPPKLAGLGSSFGSLQLSGPVKDDQFHWLRWGGVAVDRYGILNVVDDRRIQRFYTQANSKAGVAAGDLYQSWWGEFGPAPIDTFNYKADGKFTLVSGCYEYEVDPEYTSGPRKGWLGDGAWRVVGRFFDEGAGLRRTLMDGKTPREFRFVFEGTRTVSVHALTPGSDRLSAIVGANWVGADRLQNGNGGLYNWTDSNGNGEIDWGGAGSGTSGEVSWHLPMGKTPPLGPYSLHAGWADYEGNVWQIVNKDLVKIPLEGFDAQHNPIYNWAHAVTVVPFQDDDWDFQARFLRTAANGDIYALGMTKFNGDLHPTGGSNVRGGDWIARYDSKGNRKLLMPIVFDNTDNTIPAMAFDENDPNSEYFYVGVGEGSYFYIQQHTSDGLLVSKISSEDSGIETGWIDHQYGVGVVTHPQTGKTYVFGEDIVYGRNVRYRLDNLDSIHRQQGEFTWNLPRKAAGYWRFDGDLSDSVTAVNATFVSGAPDYASNSAVGQAIRLDGTSSYVELPFAADAAACTIAAWIKPGKATAANIITRSSAVSNNQDLYQLRINSAGRFEHSIVDAINYNVVGTTMIEPDTWYHVAIVAVNDGPMRLYVNGKEDGVAQNGATLAAGGDRFRIGAKSPNFSSFDGLIDDVQVFEMPLTATEIQSLYGRATVVTVAASDPRAAEANADAATFTIQRTNTRGKLVVDYTLGGTAASGTDYEPLSGSVTMADGQSSAKVSVTPIDDQANDPSETVVLSVSPSNKYIATTPSSSTIVIADNEAMGDPGWIGLGNEIGGNHFGWSFDTNHAGGAAGEIGGIFARHEKESYYADANLAQAFTLDDRLTASGKLTVFGQAHTDQEWVMGHISSNTADRAMLGIDFMEGDDNSVKFGARVESPQGGGSESDWVGLPNGKYNFTYTYDPALGNHGRIAIRIYNGSYDQTVVADLRAETRASGAVFNAFGIGTKNRPGSGDSAGKTIQMFIDDVTYSGSQQHIETK